MGTGLLQPTHLIFLLILALLLFGAKRLPEIGRSLGIGMREFKDSVTGVQDATKIDTRSELPPPQAVQAAAQPAPAPAPVAVTVPEAAPVAEAAASAPAEQETEPVS